MKKTLFFLGALPLMMLASCNSDDDMPSVDISVNYENGVQVGDTVYAVMGDTLKVSGITATPKRADKKVAIGIVNYNFDGVPYYTSYVEPYPCNIPTEAFKAGRHTLGILMPVYEVDCTPATAFVQMPLRFVESADDIPDQGVSTGHMTLQPKVNQ